MFDGLSMRLMLQRESPIRNFIAPGVFLALWLVATDGIAVQLVSLPAIQSADSGAMVQRLLVTDWQRDPEKRASAKVAYESVEPASLDVRLAYLINRLQHNETREALVVAEQLTIDYPDCLDGWLIKSYLNALVDNFDLSLIDIRSLSKRINDPLRINASQKLGCLRRMGQLIGYLQGPVNDKLNPNLMESTLTLISNAATLSELKEFDRSRDVILERFQNLLTTQNAKTERELEKQKAEDVQLIASLTQENAAHDQSIQQLLAQQERLQVEGARRIADLSEGLSPLESQLASISTQIGTIKHDLSLLYADLLFAQTQNQNLPHGHRTSTYFVSNLIRDRELSLYSLQSSGNVVSNRLQSLRAQITQTRNGYAAQVNQLQKQHTKLNNTIRRNQIKMSKVAGGPEIAGGKKDAMENRLTALTSYVELSVDLYRQQMLEQLQGN